MPLPTTPLCGNGDQHMGDKCLSGGLGKVTKRLTRALLRKCNVWIVLQPACGAQNQATNWNYDEGSVGSRHLKTACQFSCIVRHFAQYIIVIVESGDLHDAADGSARPRVGAFNEDEQIHG